MSDSLLFGQLNKGYQSLNKTNKNEGMSALYKGVVEGSSVTDYQLIAMLVNFEEIIVIMKNKSLFLVELSPLSTRKLKHNC